MATHPPIITIPTPYIRRAPHNQVLLTLRIVTPLALRASATPRGTVFHRDLWVINTRFDVPYEARAVRPNGRLRLWKRSMRLLLPWAYGFWGNRSARYGHFTSADGLTWDPDSYAPYILISQFDPLYPTDPTRTFSTPEGA